MSNPIYVKSPLVKERKRKHRKKNRKISVEEEQDSLDISPDTSFGNDDDEPIDIPKKRKHYDKFRNAIPDQNVEHEPVLNEDDSDDEEGDFRIPVDKDSDDNKNDDQILNDDDDDDDDDNVPVEQFTAPSLEESFDFESGTNEDNKNDNSNILLWIFKFQSRFCLPDTAIESLIQFNRMILIDANYKRFKDFPTSTYTAKKLLGIRKQDKTYAVCSNCNALYNIEEISTQNQSTDFKCIHIEFSNHPMQN